MDHRKNLYAKIKIFNKPHHTLHPPLSLVSDAPEVHSALKSAIKKPNKSSKPCQGSFTQSHGILTITLKSILLCSVYTDTQKFINVK